MKQEIKKRFKISSYDLDPLGRARITALANYLQEIAYLHASELGFGYHDLKKHQTFWVLSRMRIKVLRYPLWDEEIEVETFPNGIEKLFAIRAFKITDPGENLMVIASTAWLVVDGITRRPVRINDLFFRYSEKVESLFDGTMDKIELPGSMDNSGINRVRYSDLDVVGHVNNVKYIEWCIDHYSEEEMRVNEIREIEINYLNEARFGEEIMLFEKIESPEIRFYQAVRKEDQKEIFRARILLTNQAASIPSG